MAKRAPWITQTRRKIKAIREDYSQLKPSARYMFAFRFLSDPKALSYEAKQAFLGANKEEMIKAIRIIFERDGHLAEAKADSRKIKAQIVGDLSEGFVDEILEIISKGIIAKKLKRSSEKLPEHFRKYLKERRFPLVDEAIDLALAEYTQDPLKKEGFDLARFEKVYVNLLKKGRTGAHNRRRILNIVSSEILSQFKFTPKQSLLIRRRVANEFDRIMSMLPKGTLFTSAGDEHLRRLIDSALRDFINTSASEYVESFYPKQKKHTTLVKAELLPVKKLGVREERILGYVPKIKEVSPPKKTEVSRTPRRDIPFNTAEYLIQKMRVKAPRTGERIAELYTHKMPNGQRVLLGEAVARLEKSDLAQRIFVSSLDKHFVTYFGLDNIDALARGIANLVPGRKNAHAVQGFKNRDGSLSPLASNLFDFLKSNNFLETHHGGFTAVYLRKHF